MNQYLALLRGINVSGQKKIKMAELISHCLAIGFEKPSSYIQSGNVLFHSINDDPQQLALQLKEKIVQVYGYDVAVIVINKATVENTLLKLPFNDIDVANEGNKVLVSFLACSPKNEAVEHLLSYVIAPENLVIDNNVVYLHCPNGYGKSKLSNNFVENKLKVVATTRNLKTIVKLVELMS